MRVAGLAWIGGAVAACQAISGLNGFGISLSGAGGATAAAATTASATASSSSVAATGSGGATGSAESATASSTASSSASASASTASSSGTGGSSCAHYVFASATFTQPSIGVAALDALCGKEASAAGLDVAAVAWRAIVSTKAEPAVQRIPLTGDVCLANPKGTLVAPAGGLWNTAKKPLAHAIDHTAAGMFISFPEIIWTGTHADGTTAANCNDWTDANAMGLLGGTESVDAGWVAAQDANKNDYTLACSTFEPVYCISVPK